MVAALSTEKCMTDAVFCEHAIGTVAQMTLRSPSNSNKIYQTGFIEILMKCMRRHADKGAMQRQACLTIRNIAGRCQDLKGVLLDAGAEPLLRVAGRLQGSIFFFPVSFFRQRICILNFSRSLSFNLYRLC